MLRLQDLRRSSCNRLSSSGKVMCRLIIPYDFSENKTLVVQLGNAYKIYNVVAKIKKNWMGFTRSSTETVRRATYNMTLLEAIGMTSTGKSFTVATAFMCNEQVTTYKWVIQ
ncbi:hypothetical protein M9H77_02471 [Catharanthus roseus]|uniref:Uncharacterized protein n=1 Tax=Catharanthus roseus TaxID=4058 RepID=A0ACC0C8H4_CATRO|nr:hypothetical protein M9H77_02471 [Catharanthus roseus]